LSFSLSSVSRSVGDVGAFERGGEHLGALDVDRLRGQVVALARRELALQPRQFLLERLHVVHHLRDAGRDVGRLRLERAAISASSAFCCCTRPRRVAGDASMRRTPAATPPSRRS
jgi:hypothetical protein